MPELEKLRPGLAAQGIDLIGLNVDAQPDADVRGYVARRRVNYPIFVGGVGAIEQLYATDDYSVPLSILVDEKGVVKDLIPGWSSETQRKFAALIGEAAVKQPAPTKANK
jgi:hypothetical protein